MIGMLYKSHRVCGRVIALATDVDGRDLAILQTAPHREDVALVHSLMPVSVSAVEFDIRMALIETIEQARFLGLSNAQLADLFAAELARDDG